MLLQAKAFKFLLLVLAMFAAWMPLTGFAQTTGQETPAMISGQAVSAIPQADSSAATVISGQEVGVGEITAPRNLTADAPNLAVFDGDNQRLPKFTVRGFRENNFGAGAPVVGLYVDDIPYYDLNSRGTPLYDVRDLQVVRGDQGTLYGASGVEGVINVQTAQPGNNTHGSLEASYGNYDAEDYRLALGGPLVTNKLFFGVDGIYALRDGFIHNLELNDHPDTQDTLGGRGTLRWTPSDPWTITLLANAARENDGLVPAYDPLLDPGPFSVNRGYNGYVETANVDEGLKIAYQAGSIQATSITTHRQWRQNLAQDFSFGAPYFIEGYSFPRVEQWSEEFRVGSSETGGSPLDWRAGLYFLSDDQHSDSGSESFLTPVTTFDTLARLQNDTYALFGQATYRTGQHLELTAGVRLTDDEHAISRVGTLAPLGVVTGGYDLTSGSTAVQPKFAVAWHFSPTLETYASVTRGYQSGGFNPSVDNAALSSYGPESDWQFELGAKSSWLDHRLAINGDLFYTEADGYQTFRINPADPTQSYVLNAQRAALLGAELEITARPIEHLDLSAGGGYTQARYDRFVEPAVASGASVPLDLGGEPISFVPEFTANVTARYGLPWWHLYLQGQFIGVGHFELDDSSKVTTGPTTQSAYFLANAQIGYASGRWSGYLFAKNILDTHYINNALNFGGGPLILEPGDPVTFGIAVAARF